MESCAFTYDGGLNISVTITNAAVGVTYRIRCSDSNSSIVSAAAVTSTLVLNVTDVGGDPAGYKFRARVDRLDNNSFVGSTGFSEGTPGELPFLGSWSTDGANPPTVTLTFPSVNGTNYFLGLNSNGSFLGDTTFTGDGTTMTVQVTSGTGATGGYLAQLGDMDTGDDYANQMFVSGVADEGFPGNPSTTGNVLVTLDGVNVTNCCVAGNWTRRLNRPSTAQIRVPMDCATANVGSLLKISALVGADWKIVHHGRVLNVETDANEDFGYTTYNSTDPMEMWQWRPVRDNDCDFTQPLILEEYTTGPLVLEAALNNSIDCGDSSQADCEGDLFLTVNAAAGGGVDLSGAPTDWPMTIAELASLLISTGEVDVVITPTDPGGGIMGEVDFYNGDYGTDLSGTIVFSYGMGDYNVRRLRWNQDMTTMVNKLWYYGGPRIATAADPAAVQHWCWNITGDDPGLAYPPGGENSPPASATNNQLGVLRVDSKDTYGVRMDIQIFDAYDDDCVPGIGTPGRNLYRRRWQQESWLRAVPREIIHVTPIRGTEIGTFDIGDLVGVEATSAVRGGFTGAQRVYEYTVSWDQDGVLELSELQTSADNEGL